MFEVVNVATGEILGDFKSKKDAEEWAEQWAKQTVSRVVGWNGPQTLCVDDDK
jgi:hypothetical protein